MAKWVRTEGGNLVNFDLVSGVELNSLSPDQYRVEAIFLFSGYRSVLLAQFEKKEDAEKRMGELTSELIGGKVFP